MPLIQLKRILSDGGTERGGRVSVESVACWELGLVVHSIWLGEGLDVSERLEELVLHAVHKREVRPLLHLRRGQGGLPDSE